MASYQKAYYLSDLRRFPGWQERAPAQDATADGVATELVDDSIVFLNESLVVTRTCFDNHDAIVFDDVTPDWEAFCRDELKFEAPDWEAESDAVREALAKDCDTDSSPHGSGER